MWLNWLPSCLVILSYLVQILETKGLNCELLFTKIETKGKIDSGPFKKVIFIDSRANRKDEKSEVPEKWCWLKKIAERLFCSSSNSKFLLQVLEKVLLWCRLAKIFRKTFNSRNFFKTLAEIFAQMQLCFYLDMFQSLMQLKSL